MPLDGTPAPVALAYFSGLTRFECNGGHRRRSRKGNFGFTIPERTRVQTSSISENRVMETERSYLAERNTDTSGRQETLPEN